jgi:cytochrome P450
MNEKYFSDPFDFKPERFLDENNECLTDRNFMPFSVGARRCPGETLAMGEVFRFELV